MDRGNNSKVQLNGTAIRRIREEQKLTQYYIAKVVGVTTDTVSRWENNRYPSVLRDNALLLAEALEVPVEDILLDTERDDHVTGSSRSPLTRYSIIGIVVLLSIFGAYFFLSPSEVEEYTVSVQRRLPPHASIATQLPVRVQINASGTIDGMVLREKFPEGFKLIEASPVPSSLDNVNGSVRWILQPSAGPLLVSYLLKPDPVVASGDKLDFRGDLIVNSNGQNRETAVLGEVSIPVDSYHWADANRDMVIDDGEALDASVTSIAMKNVHVDWDLIEQIWDAGSYRLDPDSRKFIAERQTVPE